MGGHYDAEGARCIQASGVPHAVCGQLQHGKVFPSRVAARTRPLPRKLGPTQVRAHRSKQTRTLQDSAWSRGPPLQGRCLVTCACQDLPGVPHPAATVSSMKPCPDADAGWLARRLCDTRAAALPPLAHRVKPDAAKAQLSSCMPDCVETCASMLRAASAVSHINRAEAPADAFRCGAEALQ